ncbi:MAG: SDR family NAD(P)-dependent oxidoreductase [Methanomicrobium sp.]|nr:SDR family NAD(P)-dependent oxidoreductase [Methanomicrobium sp.]
MSEDDGTKAFVTGGNGFLGRHLIAELIKRDIDVVSYDLSKPLDSDIEKYAGCKSHIEYILGDILDKEQLLSAMRGCEIVFHTAAVADINVVSKIPEKTMEINVLGTTRCLEAAKVCGVKRFVFASSVYAAGNHGSFYSISKRACESLCKTYYEEFGLEFTILRYGSLYGTEANHWNFIYGMCKELLTTGKYTYTSSPDSLREYINILDASRESVNIALSHEFVNKTVMIAGHQRMKVSELFTMIEEIIGKKIEVNYAPKSVQTHYHMTAYSFEPDVPIRINMPHYIDISEGILECIKSINDELQKKGNI